MSKFGPKVKLNKFGASLGKKMHLKSGQMVQFGHINSSHRWELLW